MQTVTCGGIITVYPSFYTETELKNKMKRFAKSLIAVVLSLTLAFSCALPVFAAPSASNSSITVAEETSNKITAASVKTLSAAADRLGKIGCDLPDLGDDTAKADFGTTVKKLFAKFVNMLSNFLINFVVAGVLKTVIPDANTVESLEDFDLDSYAGFMPGMEKFIDEPAENAAWSLGYSRKSIMPSNFGEKSYAKGAYLPYIFGNEMYKDDDGVDEELRVRTVVMNDGSGRGTVAFLALDAMGLCNADVRKIRVALEDFAEANNIVGINVSCTHIHTGIDSQGVWTDPAGDLFHNIIKKDETVTTGVDPDFLEAVINGCKESVIEAFNGMTSGKLMYSKIDIAEYLRDRTAPKSYDENLYKLAFVPFDASVTPTIIATFGCHPESSSYDWNAKDENGKTVYDTKFTADFVWYIEKLLNSQGYNFIYIQGNVSTTTSSRGLTSDELDGNAHYSAVRYGYEIGYILLGMEMTEAERIALNDASGDKLGVKEYSSREGYSIWYDGLPTVTAEEVEPVLNVANRAFVVEISNNAIALIGKTSISNNFVLRDKLGKVYTVSEVGYMEIGDVLKVYMSPGETFTELLKGGYGADGFEFKPIREELGENVIIMDLMNDAAGYVANTENFVMAGIQYNPETGKYDGDTWCLISYGKNAARDFIGNFYELVKSKRG